MLANTSERLIPLIRFVFFEYIGNWSLFHRRMRTLLWRGYPVFKVADNYKCNVLSRNTSPNSVAFLTLNVVPAAILDIVQARMDHGTVIIPPFCWI